MPLLVAPDPVLPVRFSERMLNRSNPSTYPSDPFHLIEHHVLLLGPDYHSRPDEPHVSDDLLRGKLILVNQVRWLVSSANLFQKGRRSSKLTSDQDTGSTETRFTMDRDFHPPALDRLFCEMNKVADNVVRWIRAIIEVHLDMIHSEIEKDTPVISATISHN